MKKILIFLIIAISILLCAGNGYTELTSVRPAEQYLQAVTEKETNPFWATTHYVLRVKIIDKNSANSSTQAVQVNKVLAQTTSDSSYSGSGNFYGVWTETAAAVVATDTRYLVGVVLSNLENDTFATVYVQRGGSNGIAFVGTVEARRTKYWDFGISPITLDNTSAVQCTVGSKATIRIRSY